MTNEVKCNEESALTDLLCCPFCGGEAKKKHHDYYSIYEIMCTKCFARVGDEKKWNARKDDPDLIKKLNDAIDLLDIERRVVLLLKWSETKT